MMKYCCSKLDDYLDGELTADEVVRFHQSIKSCGECTEALEANQIVTTRLNAGWDAVATPRLDLETLDPGHKTELAKDSVRESFTRVKPHGIHVGFVVASILVLFGLALLMGQQLFRAEQPADVANQKQDDNSESKRKANEQNDESQNTLGEVSNDKDAIDKDAIDKDAIDKGAIAKAAVEFPESFVGVRLDEPGDDFTFINVYETVNTRPSNRDPANQDPADTPRNKSKQPFGNL